jgi:hypothetical protein
MPDKKRWPGKGQGLGGLAGVRNIDDFPEIVLVLQV